MTKHTLLTRDEALRARELIRERLGHDRILKITAAALTKGQADGTFTGYASTFGGEPDLAGDVVAPGAFAQSIRDWRARGAMPPLLWNHETDSPNATLGVILDVREDQRGLLVTGQLDLDHEPAVAVWKGMKSGRLTTFSFAYAVLEEHRNFDGVNSLDVLDVLEVSVTPSPANRNAQLVSVKAQPEPRTEIDELMARIDAPVQRGKADPGAVDRLVTEVKLERVHEKLAEAEQAAWERQIQVNLVLEPVTVRVDARMRPVTG